VSATARGVGGEEVTRTTLSDLDDSATRQWCLSTKPRRGAEPRLDAIADIEEGA